jgi:hypothetical protein
MAVTSMLLPGARLAIEDRTCAVMRPSVSAAFALASSDADAGAAAAGVASEDASASLGAGGDDGVAVPTSPFAGALDFFTPAADVPRRLSCLGLGTFVSLLAVPALSVPPGTAGFVAAEFAASGGLDG